MWKRRFPVLSMGMNIKLETVLAVIVATAVLHNIARRFGIDEPLVLRRFERYVQLHNVPILPGVDGRNRSPHRRKFIHYFSTL